jgi:hypothetical protein
MEREKQESLYLQKFIIMVVIVGVVLVLGIYINDVIGQTMKDTNVAGTIANETVTGLTNVSGAGDYLSVYTLEDVLCTIGVVLNATSNVTVPASNYTNVNCLMYATNGSAYTGFNVKVSYTYTYTNDTAASLASDSVVSALSTGTSWISILVVVGFATIILTMLTSGLGGAARRDSEVPYY